MSVMISLVPNQDLPASQYSDAQFVALADALTAWVDQDVGPAWGQDWQGHYTIKAIPRGAPVPAHGPRSWVFDCRMHSTVQGAAGWHSADPQGNPYGEIAMGDILAIGMHPEGVASHEVVETLVNRFVDGAVLAQRGNLVGAWQTEAGDPVELYGYPFAHAGHTWQMTDFCLPSYFHAAASGPYSFRGRASAPLTPAQGCRQYYWDGQGWHVVNAAGTKSPTKDLPKVHRGVPLGGSVVLPKDPS